MASSPSKNGSPPIFSLASFISLTRTAASIFRVSDMMEQVMAAIFSFSSCDKPQEARRTKLRMMRVLFTVNSTLYIKKYTIVIYLSFKKAFVTPIRTVK